MKEYRYHTRLVRNDLAGAVARINLHHPHWDVVTMQEFSSCQTVIVYRTLEAEQEYKHHDEVGV